MELVHCGYVDVWAAGDGTNLGRRNGLVRGNGLRRGLGRRRRRLWWGVRLGDLVVRGRGVGAIGEGGDWDVAGSGEAETHGGRGKDSCSCSSYSWGDLELKVFGNVEFMKGE